MRVWINTLLALVAGFLGGTLAQATAPAQAADITDLSVRRLAIEDDYGRERIVLYGGHDGGGPVIALIDEQDQITVHLWETSTGDGVLNVNSGGSTRAQLTGNGGYAALWMGDADVGVDTLLLSATGLAFGQPVGGPLYDRLSGEIGYDFGGQPTVWVGDNPDDLSQRRRFSRLTPFGFDALDETWTGTKGILDVGMGTRAHKGTPSIYSRRGNGKWKFKK